MRERPIIAICGKGGVGKTVLTALLAQVLLTARRHPLLLIDADPAAGLCAAIGERGGKTLGQVRAEIIAAARHSDDSQRRALADQVDYLLLEALCEREDYALLAMGRTYQPGCYCAVNKLLRSAIELLIEPYAAVLIDAEAGIEQLNREVTRQVTTLVGVTDGSRRSLDTLLLIADLTTADLGVVSNRGETLPERALPPGARYLGSLPEDPALRALDREGRRLWDLPADSPARRAALPIAEALGLVS